MHFSYVIIAGLLGGGAFAHPPSQNQAEVTKEAANLSDRIFCIQVSADFRRVENVPMIDCLPGISQLNWLFYLSSSGMCTVCVLIRNCSSVEDPLLVARVGMVAVVVTVVAVLLSRLFPLGVVMVVQIAVVVVLLSRFHSDLRILSGELTGSLRKKHEDKRERGKGCAGLLAFFRWHRAQCMVRGLSWTILVSRMFISASYSILVRPGIM